MNILVVNCGSSSIKYQIFDVLNSSVLASGLIEKIGEPESRLTHRWLNLDNKFEEVVETQHVSDHRKGFDWIVDVSAKTASKGKKLELSAIGHRVVHGGELFSEPTMIDDKVIEVSKSTTLMYMRNFGSVLRRRIGKITLAYS